MRRAALEANGRNRRRAGWNRRSTATPTVVPSLRRRDIFYGMIERENLAMIEGDNGPMIDGENLPMIERENLPSAERRDYGRGSAGSMTLIVFQRPPRKRAT
jgi:hypothetical protein